MSLLLVQGDAAHIPLADASVHCCVTSPPYYGLRSYAGLPPTVWPGGSYIPVLGAPPVCIPGPQDASACTHIWQRQARLLGDNKPSASSTLQDHGPDGRSPYLDAQEGVIAENATCEHCAAWRGCLGNEPTPSMYLWHLLLCLREIKRVLREDGVLWLNIADSFCTNVHTSPYGKNASWHSLNTLQGPRMPPGYSQGSLLGIPAQLQLAVMADGWIVRQECIWQKISPMPESVGGWAWQHQFCPCGRAEREVRVAAKMAATGLDRAHVYGRDFSTTPAPDCPTCHGTGRTAEIMLRKGSWRHTRATESVFMLCKQMGYWSNGENAREAGSLHSHGGGQASSQRYMYKTGRNDGRRAMGIPAAAYGGRNPRNILIPRASSVVLDHYARFPPGLIEPLIAATTPERVCQCGQPWAPVVSTDGEIWEQRKARGDHGSYGMSQNATWPGGIGHSISTVHGLRPTCSCPAWTPWQPGVVLDPFGGAGTVLLVARALGRHSVTLEASPTYTRLARKRLGLEALDAWREGGMPVEETFTDLPLFGGEI